MSLLTLTTSAFHAIANLTRSRSPVMIPDCLPCAAAESKTRPITSRRTRCCN